MSRAGKIATQTLSHCYIVDGSDRRGGSCIQQENKSKSPKCGRSPHSLLLLSLLQALAYAVDPPDKSDAKCSGGADGENGYETKNLAGSNINTFTLSVFSNLFFTHARKHTHALI